MADGGWETVAEAPKTAPSSGGWETVAESPKEEPSFIDRAKAWAQEMHGHLMAEGKEYADNKPPGNMQEAVTRPIAGMYRDLYKNVGDVMQIEDMFAGIIGQADSAVQYGLARTYLTKQGESNPVAARAAAEAA